MSEREPASCPDCGAAGPGPCPRCAPDRPPEAGLPRHIADYEVLGTLGAGGMGVIYRARHLTIRHVVALKVVGDHALVSDEARRRFVAEIKAAAALDHPNI